MINKTGDSVSGKMMLSGSMKNTGNSEYRNTETLLQRVVQPLNFRAPGAHEISCYMDQKDPTRASYWKNTSKNCLLSMSKIHQDPSLMQLFCPQLGGLCRKGPIPPTLIPSFVIWSAWTEAAV